MAVRVEREPRHLQPAVADGPQHGKAADVVEAVGGVDDEEDLCQIPSCVMRRRLRLLLPWLRDQPGQLLRRPFIPPSAVGCSSTACTVPSIPASSPAHSNLLPQDDLALSPVTDSAHLHIACGPTPTLCPRVAFPDA